MSTIRINGCSQWFISVPLGATDPPDIFFEMGDSIVLGATDPPDYRQLVFVTYQTSVPLMLLPAGSRDECHCKLEFLFDQPFLS